MVHVNKRRDDIKRKDEEDKQQNKKDKQTKDKFSKKIEKSHTSTAFKPASKDNIKVYIHFFINI